MKYQTLGQYFYKLYAIIFMMVLAPLLLFIFLYQAMGKGFITAPMQFQDTDYILYGLAGLVLLDWIAAFVLFNIRLKSTRKIVSLGERLDLYANLTIVRSAVLVSGMILLALGYFVLEHQWLTIAFIVGLGVQGLLWPLPSKVCRDLKLKGDEKLMVLYQMDRF